MLFLQHKESVGDNGIIISSSVPKELKEDANVSPKSENKQQILPSTIADTSQHCLNPNNCLTVLEDDSSIFSVDNIYLAVPTNCRLPKSQLLTSFFTKIHSYSHSHSEDFGSSFLVCSPFLCLLKDGQVVSLDTYLNSCCDRFDVLPMNSLWATDTAQHNLHHFSLSVFMFCYLLKSSSLALHASECSNISAKPLVDGFSVRLQVLQLLPSIIWFRYNNIYGRWISGFIFDRGKQIFKLNAHYSLSYIGSNLLLLNLAWWIFRFLFDRGKLFFKLKCFEEPRLVCGGVLRTQAANCD